MSKYDFEIDVSLNSSTGLILSKINKGSVVLEFGCAAGRMTRYMKEVLGCQVYIVEFDEDAYETARRYAEDGLCDDILKFKWTEKFQGISFDAVIFADVLEHLKTPEKVLKEASKLLKDTGSIYISIPNITHNDIWVKAYEEHFDYTATGILDDTHVHFWGLHNIGALAEDSGLHIRSIEGTYCPTGLTEQYAETKMEEHVLLLNILKERMCGEVYQFVLALDKNGAGQTMQTFQAPSVRSHIYLDTGKDFNSEEIIAFDAASSGRGSYIAHFEIHNTENLNRVRFDPIEFQGCILRDIKITQGKESLPLSYVNAAPMEEGILLLGNDPMVWVNVSAGKDPVIIDAEIIIVGEKYIEIIDDAYTKKCAESEGRLLSLNDTRERLQGEVNGLRAENGALQGSIAALNGEKQALLENVAVLNSKKQTLEESVDALNREKAEMNRDLGAYILLANNKDRYALTLECALHAKEEELQDKEVQLQRKNEELQDKEAQLQRKNEELQRKEQELRFKEEILRLKEEEVNYYKNLRVVRLRAFAVRIVKGVIRRLRRILRKEAQ